MERYISDKGRVRISAIDIGTNTILLLIADIDEKKKIITIRDEIRTPRLGEGINKSGIIIDSALKRTIDNLLEFENIISTNNVNLSTVCGTAVFRDSLNKNSVISTIKSKTGISVEVIDSKEESRLSFRGVLSSGHFAENESVVIDIGGGSTEIAYMADGKIKSYSLPLGAVKLTEQFFTNIPPAKSEISRMINHINKEIENIDLENISSKKLIGVAGTPITLACLDKKLQYFDRNAIDAHSISFQKILNWEKLLSTLTPLEIKSLSKCTEGREDILTTGVIILTEVMKKYHFNEMIVSTRGLRYGLILREWECYKNNLK